MVRVQTRHQDHFGSGRNNNRGRGRGRGQLQRVESSICLSDREDEVEELGVASSSRCPALVGKVNGKPVMVMRDTGCTCVVVRRDLVRNSQKAGRRQSCRYVDNSVRNFPVAVVDIECPHFTRTVEALCVESSMYDLVLRNIMGAKYPEPRDVIAQAVTMRSQVQQQGKPYRGLNVPSTVVEISKDECLQNSEQGSNLEK